MMKTLRRKFVVITMCSVCVVLFLIMGIINLVSFREINREADEVLEMLTDNEGIFPKLDKPLRDFKEKPNGLHGLSPEMPYETRFFSVTLDEQGEVIVSNTGSIAALEREEAVGYAKTVFAEGKKSGFKGSYKYSMVKDGAKTIVVFLDCTRSLSNFRSFLFISIVVSFLGLLTIFILVTIFSGRAVKPVAESYAKQKRFLTDAGHEIKTPLAIIKTNAEVLELESGENEWTASIRNQIERLSALTESLVSLAKMDETQNALPMEVFDFSATVRDAADAFLMSAERRKIELSSQIEENITLSGNEKSMRHLLSILLDNAVKYADESGSILLSLKKQGNRVVLTVYNTVEQIEEGNLNILFERFYRRDASRNSETGGHGIGLSLAKSIVEAHKGKITARSVDGKSLEIFIQL